MKKEKYQEALLVIIHICKRVKEVDLKIGRIDKKIEKIENE